MDFNYSIKNQNSPRFLGKIMHVMWLSVTSLQTSSILCRTLCSYERTKGFQVFSTIRLLLFKVGVKLVHSGRKNRFLNNSVLSRIYHELFHKSCDIHAFQNGQ